MNPMFTIFGHDNGIAFFKDRKDVRRCTACGQLVSKWTENLQSARLPPRLNYDVSTSYDGVVVVSPRFRAVYGRTGMVGLRFVELAGYAFAVQATEIVPFDAQKRGTRLESQCSVCRQYESIVGATPAYLMSGARVPEMGFARTDLEFGSGDEQMPLLIGGSSAAAILEQEQMTGMDLKEVRHA